jgi:hypothetical protein
MKGSPDNGGPPDHVDLPDSVPKHVKERIMTGRSIQNDGQTSLTIGI